MIHLNDVIVDKYLNDELLISERDSFLKHVEECESCKKEFGSILKLNNNLYRIADYTAPAKINELVMKKIVRPVSNSVKGRGFFIGIISTLATIIFIWLGYIASYIFEELTSKDASGSFNVSEKIQPLINQITAAPIMKYTEAYTLFLLFMVVTSGYILYTKIRSFKH